MLSAELVAPRVIELRERPLPQDPKAGEVLVRLRAVGLCGSDLHWYQDGRVGHSEGRFPMVLGHEPVGEVVAVGAGVTSHRVGQKVAIEPTVSCGKCVYCRTGHPNNCPEGVFMGGPQSPGFYREYAAVPTANAEILPESFSWIDGVLVEPVAVILHVLQITDVPPSASIAVLGAGPIGLLMAHIARMRGAQSVLIADRVLHRLKMANRMGVTSTLLNIGPSFASDLMESTNGQGVDLVFDCAGTPETIQAGLELVKPGGVFTLVGLPSERIFPIDIHVAMAKELRIHTLKRSNHQGHPAIELIAEGKIPDLLVTHRLGLESTGEAFELVTHYRDGVGKLVIEMPE